MFEETTVGNNLTRKATLLMAEVLQLANKVLPLSVAAKVQVSHAVCFTCIRPDHFSSLFLASSALRRITTTASIE